MATYRRTPGDTVPIIIRKQTDVALDRAKQAIGQAAARSFSAQVASSKNYASLLSDLWSMANSLLEEIKVSDDPLPKKVAMLRDAAKLLPLLDRAESRHRHHLGKRAVTDLTDSEISQTVRQLLLEEKKQE